MLVTSAWRSTVQLFTRDVNYSCMQTLALCGVVAGDDSLLRTGDDKLPADSLVLSTQQIWEVIKSQKDLNLPAHKVCRS